MTKMTIMDTNREVFRNFPATSTADLTCTFSWHFYYLSPSFFRFGFQNRKEVKPRYIPHRPIESSKRFPAIKFFYTNNIVFFKQLIGSFKMKVFPLVKNLLMNFSNKYFSFLSSDRTFFLSRKQAQREFGKTLTLSERSSN